MLVHPAAGRDPAASGQGLRPVPDDAQPWPIGEGRRGGTVHECCCVLCGCPAKFLTCCGPCLRPSTARHDPSDLCARAAHGAPPLRTAQVPGKGDGPVMMDAAAAAAAAADDDDDDDDG